MSQVIIVSNRLPISVRKEDGKLVFYPSLGGLATGLSSYVKNRRNRWIGWPGIASDGLSDNEKQQIVDELAKYNYTPVFLSKKQVDDFYNGYSNTVLWPLFHNLKRARVGSEKRKRWWQAYRRVNEMFAQAALNLAETGGHVWVHDYQLMLVPELFRAERRDVISGFFLHIPFPESDRYNRLPEKKKLLSGILGADVIGFHTPSYVDNFLDSCVANELPFTDSNEVIMEDRTVRVADFPMGIDYQKYAAAIKAKTVKQAVKRYRKKYGRRTVVVAIDRLDPSKGLLERLEAYKTLLERRPRLKNKIVFAMVAAPSRTEVPAYQQLSKRLDALVDKINKQFGSPKWQPVDYMNVAQPFEEVTALFQIADIAFIAPLRDGMNLAAKEFIASKRRSGILILSETAGAASELPDALLVDPKDPESLVEALQQALSMKRRELRGRLKRMQQQLSSNTVQEWAKDFVDALQQPIPGTPVIAQRLKGNVEVGLINDWRKAEKRLFLLDYDGSLVAFARNFRASQPPKALLRLLETLSADKQTELVIISGRSSDDLDTWFGHLDINLVAEHGAAIKKSSSQNWRTIESTSTRWKSVIQPVLRKYADLTPGAQVEVKPHALVWHYRSASAFYAQKYAVTLKRVLKPYLKTYGLELVQGNKILEIKNPRINKGSAARSWLRHKHDFILAIGDDATDEDLFKILPDGSYSIKVGRGRSGAHYRLASSKEVLALLHKLV